MKAVFYKIPRTMDQSIRAEQWEPADFFTPVHYHRECQLTLIRSGSGYFYTSDSSTPFSRNDLFLIGENVPHVFKSNTGCNGQAGQAVTRGITVFFDHEQLSVLLKTFPEAGRLLRLCRDSRHGIKATVGDHADIQILMNQIVNGSAVSRISDLLKVLEALSNEESLTYVSHHPVSLKDPLDSNKIEYVLRYVQDNFKKQLTLEDIASQINMSPSAFCRFFKKKTARTITDYLIDIRISAACKMLTQGDFTVSETCYESGYNSTSNFHRHFRRVTGCSPKEYKRRVLA